MGKKAYVALLACFMLIVGAAIAHAGIMETIQNQQKRIDQGIASGSLTRHEADVLQDNLNWIKERFATLKADGRLTPEERKNLEAMLARNGKMIANKKHNAISKVYGETPSQARSEDFMERVDNQQRRIDAGIASGTLTRHEADVVQDNLTWIKSTYSKMKADGRLSAKEAQRLDKMLDRNSRMIQNKKSNPIKKVY